MAGQPLRLGRFILLFVIWGLVDQRMHYGPLIIAGVLFLWPAALNVVQFAPDE